jgi:hypothetical protein
MEESFWREDQIILLAKFPEGQLVIVVEGVVSTIIIISYGRFCFKTVYKAITGNFTFSTHNPDGEVLYN